LKKKWKNLRDCYAKHLRSEVVTHTGQERKILDRYKTWPWAKQMEIFKPFLQFASTNTNVANVPGGYETIPLQSEGEEVLRSDNAGADTVSQNEDDLFHGGPLSPNASIITNAPVTSTQTVVTQTTNTSDTATTKTPVTPRTNTSQRNSTTRKRRLEEQTQTPTSIDKVIAYFDKKPCNNTQAGYDDVDLIFLSYAKTLKKFSPRRQTMTKFKIAQLLMEEELNQQAEDGYTTTTVSVHPGPSSTETSAMTINSPVSESDYTQMTYSSSDTNDHTTQGVATSASFYEGFSESLHY
jgi:hypothetical protein